MTGSYPGRRIPAPDAPRWDGAACRDLNVDLFFPEQGANGSVVKHAKQVCSLCPIRGRCLDYALQFDPRDLPGIWGGTTGRERHLLRRTLRLF